jgi:tRNA G18 (ribose-2'-O)-methylase SpoU
MVTDRYQHVLHHPTVDDLLLYARERNVPIVAIDNVERSVAVEETVLPRQCILLFGQEGPGLSPEALEAADLVVEITQYGSTRSLNASAAAAIVMHQWVVHHASRL